MLANYEYVNRNPSPWQKVGGNIFGAVAYLLLGQAKAKALTGFEVVHGISIAPNEKKEESEAFEAAEAKWLERRALETKAAEEAAEKLQKELGIQDEAIEEDDMATAKTSAFKKFAGSVNPLKPILHPIQLQLRGYAVSLRILKSVVLWEDKYYSFWITVACFVGSVAIIWIPFGFILRWLFRIIALLAFGPWMAIVDHYYFKGVLNLTDEEHAKLLEERFQSAYAEAVELAMNNQIKKERAFKLKSMKEFMFGRFLLAMPRFCEETFRDVPLPESFARPFPESEASQVIIAEKKYGQNLSGDMIPIREIQGAAKPRQKRGRGRFSIARKADESKVDETKKKI
jgi:hypothetical protein